MRSPCLSIAMLLLAWVASAAASPALRICADPDNLPFSDRQGRGFDDRIAVLVAHEVGRTPVFVWARSRRGFLREEFNKGACDVLFGVPEGLHGVLTTHSYYRSSYVFVTRHRFADSGGELLAAFASIDSERPRRATDGVRFIWQTRRRYRTRGE